MEGIIYYGQDKGKGTEKNGGMTLRSSSLKTINEKKPLTSRSRKPVCECHKINWSHKGDHAFHYKDSGKLISQETSLDCQAKVNRGEMTMNEYLEVCKMTDEDIQKIFAHEKPPQRN